MCSDSTCQAQLLQMKLYDTKIQYAFVVQRAGVLGKKMPFLSRSLLMFDVLQRETSGSRRLDENGMLKYNFLKRY